MPDSSPQSVPWLTAKEPLTENERAIIAEVIERGDNPVELRRWLRHVIRIHDSLEEQLETLQRQADANRKRADVNWSRAEEAVEQLETVRWKLNQAEAFIEHQGADYRYAEWVAKASSPARES